MPTQAALDLAEDGEDGVIGATGDRRARRRRPSNRSASPTAPDSWPRDPEADLRAQPPALDIDLDAPLYTVKDAEAVAAPVLRRSHYGEELEVAPGVHATFLDAGHILGSAIIRVRVTEHDGRRGALIVFSGDVGRPGTPILRDPTPS